MNCFTLAASDAGARAGTLHTAHGDIATPVFMPVGTQASVKGLTPEELRECSAGMILANAYHLYLRPGADVIARAGGLHAFMSWPGAILTDSGGFQIFSLARLSRVDDGGYHFASHLDGSRHTFTPEFVVALQEQFGSDVAMVLDELVPAGVDEQRAREAAGRTLAWAKRARASITRSDQLTFAIVQGATFDEVRRRQALELAALDFPGYAIGGLWVGEERSIGLSIVETTTQVLPAEKPRYLMGVGTAEDVIEAIARGIDMFDCVYPTRCARHALALTSSGRLNLRNATYGDDFGALDATCTCATCAQFSRAYIAHLFKAGELLAARLVSLHNLSFLRDLTCAARQAIIDGRFAAWRAQRHESLAQLHSA